MVVCSAGYDLVTLVLEGLCHCGGVGHHLFLVFLEFRLQSLVECDCLCGDAVLERSALHSREYAGVEYLRHLLHNTLRRGESPRIVEILAHEDDPSARPSEGLVRGGCHDMGIFDRVAEQSCGYESGSMGHVHHEDGPDLVGNLAHSCIVPFAGICGSSSYYEFRPRLHGRLFHSVIVYESGLLIETVCHCVVQYSRHVDRGAVSQVASMRQVKSHESVAGLQACHQNCHVGLRPGMRLYVCVFGLEKLAESLYGKLLYLVDHFTTSVISRSRISLRVFVGTYRTESIEHLLADVVFRCYELKP